MNLIGRLLIQLKMRLHENALRAERPRPAHGHGRMDAVAPRLVRRRGHHAAPRQAAYDDRLSLPLRMLPLLDGSEKSIHIYMHDPATHSRSPFLFLYYTIAPEKKLRKVFSAPFQLPRQMI